MKMIIGGAYQGKTAYAEKIYGIETWVDGAACSREAIYDCCAVNHFHLYVRRMLAAGEDVSTLAANLIERNPELLIISTEVGCGVVPVDQDDRNYREVLGRICTELAGYAAKVHRVVCGIGTVIKDD